MSIIHHAAGSGVPECFLILTDPHWGLPKISYHRSSRQAEALTGIEDRAGEQRASRLRQEITLRMSAQEAADFRGMLATMAGIRVGVPLWCDADRSDWLHAPQRVISWNDGGSYAVVAAGSPRPYARNAPLLIGRITERPSITPGPFYDVTFTVEEDSPWSCRIEPAAGAIPTSFPVDPEWTKRPEDMSRDQLRVTQLGQGREVFVAGADGRPRWGQKAGFKLSRAEAADLLRFWNDRDGSVKSFSVPAWCTPGEDTPQTPHTLTARFDKDVLQLAFTSPNVIGCELAVWQEVTLEDGSSQASESKTYFYVFLAEGSTTKRYTSWEHDLTWVGYTYEPQGISHSNLRLTLTPTGSECEISTFAEWAANPLRPFVLASSERRIRVQVYEALVNSSGVVTRVDELISGEIRGLSHKDDKIVGIIKGFGGAFSRKLPRFYVQKGCNYVFGDAGCGLNKADFAKAGTLGTGLPSTSIAFTPASAPTGDYADKWFAGGWIEVTSTDGEFHRRAILDCSEAGGAWTLTIHRPLPATCNGQAATAYPGDDGNYSTCIAKFGNGDRFGGHTFAPAFVSTSDGTAQARVK